MGLFVLVMVMASVGRLDTTEAAWTVVLGPASWGAGLALTALLTAALGVADWGWFTAFIETWSGAPALAGDDVVRLAVFVPSTLAVAASVVRFHHVIKENAHG